jgi:ribose 5-phosphate isomerase B
MSGTLNGLWSIFISYESLNMPEKTSKTIAIACDHGGIELKEALAKDLESDGFEVLDLGTNGPESVDYPDFAYALAHAIKDGRVAQGVLVCGSGIGISMAANRFPEIRAALVHDALGARMCREHNDANVSAFGGRMVGIETARDCLKTFLSTDFEGGRHEGRVDKLSNPN